MTEEIFVHRNAHPTPELDSPWPGTVIDGDPHTVTLNGYQSDDGKKLMGIWISTPGTWRIDYDSWEYCHFLEGYSIITPDGGEPIHLRAGDVFVVPSGTKGTWQVVETVRKYYVFVL